MKKPKVIIYDSDGMLTNGPRFSEKYSDEFDLDINEMLPFFRGPFKDCLVGKADLKEELEKVLDVWKWDKGVEELLEYWFSVGDNLNDSVYNSISVLKTQKLICCLATNQEKYRTKYLVNKFRYDEVFNEVISSAYIGFPKTSPEGLDHTFKLLQKYGSINKNEIVYWDDDDDNIKNLNDLGFNAQKYTDFDSFREIMLKHGYKIY